MAIRVWEFQAQDWKGSLTQQSLSYNLTLKSLLFFPVCTLLLLKIGSAESRNEEKESWFLALHSIKYAHEQKMDKMFSIPKSIELWVDECRWIN